MIAGARYVHTNLIARDWRALATFYRSVFGCVDVPPERDYSGPSLEAGTGVPGASLRGVHLRLPGNGADGPTLEIFTYGHLAEVVTLSTSTGRVTWCYVTDPEGNIIELQSWS